MTRKQAKFQLLSQETHGIVPLTNDINILGVDELGVLCVGDPAASRHSALLSRRGDSFFVEPIGKARVFINSERLESSHQLINGDVVTFENRGTAVFLEVPEDATAEDEELLRLAGDLRAGKSPSGVDPLVVLAKLADRMKLTDEAAIDIAANTDIPEIDETNTGSDNRSSGPYSV